MAIFFSINKKIKTFGGKMRSLLIISILSFFATHSIALNLNEKIAILKTKAASGQNIQPDITSLAEEIKKNSQSLVVTHKVDFSIIDNDGNVSLFVPGKPNSTVISNNTQHEINATNAINKHPPAKAAQNPEGTATLGGTSNDGGFSHLITSILGAVTSIGGDAVSGAVSGIAEAIF